MNELVFIENGQVIVSSIVVAEETEINIRYFKSETYDYVGLLDCAAHLSFSSYELGLDNVLKIIDLAKMIRLGTQKNTHFLEHSVTNLVMSNWLNSVPKERDLQEKFRDEVEMIIPNSKLVKVKNHPKHQADEWIMIDGVLTPVEIKINEFTEKSLIQLQRYMEHYNSEQGLAVAPKLKCNLPENIEFLMLKP